MRDVGVNVSVFFGCRFLKVQLGWYLLFVGAKQKAWVRTKSMSAFVAPCCLDLYWRCYIFTRIHVAIA
ncbi:hypothetical protein AXFE_13340 [Acidithrix ferrooxidans]|uniref:Uncharacterized protein n=1 Tax=Acidithrix ferrooxidans TaxID=1280514 RepID=A0A0D8HJ99_9ACTN|nr:hypothetical protein AXFE_13340 [Acidithrix ferrooxidans]